MGTECLICGITEGRLVTDHNHANGMVRGTLCELCNSWLGVFEQNKRRSRGRKPLGSQAFRIWALTYEKQIYVHLQRNTGVAYRGLCKRRTAKTQCNARDKRPLIDAIVGRTLPMWVHICSLKGLVVLENKAEHLALHTRYNARRANSLGTEMGS